MGLPSRSSAWTHILLTLESAASVYRNSFYFFLNIFFYLSDSGSLRSVVDVCVPGCNLRWPSIARFNYSQSRRWWMISLVSLLKRPILIDCVAWFEDDQKSSIIHLLPFFFTGATPSCRPLRWWQSLSSVYFPLQGPISRVTIRFFFILPSIHTTHCCVCMWMEARWEEGVYICFSSSFLALTFCHAAVKEHHARSTLIYRPRVPLLYSC